jgi:ParB-like chromosome segregation protein Spo0J
MSAQQKPVHKLVWISIFDILPSPENAELYRPVTPDDPETLRLADSIRAEGVKEPLVITQDNYILSGHRRHMAARMAGLDEVPCRYSDIWHDDPQFVKELAIHNLQRVKSRDEVLREAILGVDLKKAHKALSAYRKSKSPDPS